MREKLILNDIHLGVQRSAGTTPKTAFALGQYLLDSFAAILTKNRDKDLIILGDLFDEFDVPEAVQILAFVTLKDHIENSEGDIVLVPGNHDVAKDTSRKSSFEYLCEVLSRTHPDRVIVVSEPREVWPGHYFIPHLPNQEMFNAALAAVPVAEKKPSLLYLHCNYDNGFAAQGDHSLNISAEQAQELRDARGWHMVIAHEHQARTFSGVTVLGNQWPSSIADCLKNPGNRKWAHVIAEDGSIAKILTWAVEGRYVEVPIADVEAFDPTGLQFIKVVGRVPSLEAARVMALVSKLRQRSDAFVVSPALTYEGQDDVSDLEKNVEEMEGIDVLEYLLEQLDADQAVVVKDLLAKKEINDAA